MFLLFNIFKKKKGQVNNKSKNKKTNIRRKEKVANRKGELGEYKIDIQLDQLPTSCKSLSDLLIKNPKSKTGYSQVDHVVIAPYGIFVIETKNYQGTIYGGKKRRSWSVNGKHNVLNPFIQNYGHIEALKTSIQERFHKHLYSIVSFTKRCTFKVELDLRKAESDELIIYDIELLDYLHKKEIYVKVKKEKALLEEHEIDRIFQAIKQANIIDPVARKEHVESLKQNNNTGSDRHCVICKKTVSEKVAAYCKSNERFKGEIYCYEHQKNVK